MIKAIETEYRGYRFRSRLEARWAVFFDALKITWRYEHQGYEKGGKRYLPDFEIDLWNGRTFFVEVKGDPDAIAKDYERYAALLDWGSCLPEFDESYDTKATGWILLGEIPEPRRGTWFHPIIRHHQSLHRNWFCFSGQNIGIVEEGVLADLSGLTPDNCIEGAPDHWTIEARFREFSCLFTGIEDAYGAARKARFEHGESGYSK